MLAAKLFRMYFGKMVQVMMTFLAPMDDVTDTVFRRVVSDCAPPDYTVTEFVNVDGLESVGRARIVHKLSTAQDTVPVIAQIWGKRPENFRAVARQISDGELGEFAGIDLNFGCPDKAVVKNECCSAMQQPELWGRAGEIIQATMDGANEGKNKLPVSVKTRLGFAQIDYGWHEFILKFKPAILTVHVRTTKQMSKVPADWAAIEPILRLRDKLSPETKIILNGDIMNAKQGQELSDKYGVDGVMIGRGVFTDPYCFDSSGGETWARQGREQRIELFKKHLILFSQTYIDNQRKFNPLKKFAKVYISGFAGAAELRDKVMQTNSIDEALEVIAANE